MGWGSVREDLWSALEVLWKTRRGGVYCHIHKLHLVSSERENVEENRRDLQGTMGTQIFQSSLHMYSTCWSIKRMTSTQLQISDQHEVPDLNKWETRNLYLENDSKSHQLVPTYNLNIFRGLPSSEFHKDGKWQAWGWGELDHNSDVTGR